jgi:hypothetical protein
MGSDFNQNSDNDIPDWLKGMGEGNDNAEFDSGDQLSSDSSDQENIPDWLSNIRESEDDDAPTFMDEEVPDEDTDSWLDSIREKHQAETENLKKQSQDEEETDSSEESDDYMEKIRRLKEADESSWSEPEEEDSGWGSPPEEDQPDDEIAAAWASDSDEPGSAEEEEDLPDWLSGLPSLDPIEQPSSLEDDSDDDEDVIPDWLRSMDQPSAQSEPSPQDEVEENIEEKWEAEEEETPVEQDQQADLPHVSPLSEPPPTTSSLPTWLENLQTSGLTLPEDIPDDDEEVEEGFAESFDLTQEDVSSVLSEADDLPDWIGEDVEEREEEEEEEEEPEIPRLIAPSFEREQPLEESDEEEEIEIEKAELPTWLQAMRPVEAVTSATDIEEDEGTHREQEKVGPLSGLRDVLPAEPHVVHFGSQATPVPSFTQTDMQKQYSKLLLNLVEEETTSPPAEKRGVALPQQILRWVIAVILVAVLVFVLWFRVDVFGMPSVGVPQENIDVVNAVNSLSAGQRVLVAFEYQPALSGEMESVTAGIINHILSLDAEMVLFSSQPTGPGLAETFLQRAYLNSETQSSQQYTNLGYLSGGSAALLNFANNPRRAMPLQDAAGASLWDQTPLAGINTIKDFSLVLVITDDPDTARSWVEQVQPLLDPAGDGTGTPLIMAVSAQAEPLVYPYYVTSPQQVTGYVSGLSGGAFYESYSNTQLIAHQYWNAYNIGLLLTVFIIAIGAVFNLARQSFTKAGRGRS